jgi:hypothetical protein
VGVLLGVVYVIMGRGILRFCRRMKEGVWILLAVAVVASDSGGGYLRT